MKGFFRGRAPFDLPSRSKPRSFTKRERILGIGCVWRTAIVLAEPVLHDLCVAYLRLFCGEQMLVQRTVNADPDG